jgi:hypothetical protein
MPSNVPASVAASPAKPPVQPRGTNRRVTMTVAANKAATPEKPAAPVRRMISPKRTLPASGTTVKPALTRPAVR